MKRLFMILVLIFIHLNSPAGQALSYPCEPTPPDLLGPFYQPNAPERNQVGTGYLLTGEIKSAVTCKSISGAKVEIWMAGPDGQYGNQWRATIFSDKDGTYHFSSHLPGPYGGRPPHLHMIISAPGFKELTTQHYPQKGKETATFDIILIPVR
jgi:protocatechuate 3,4-dioxygenase beta subunit